MSSIIAVKNISKLYRIGGSPQGRDVLVDSPHGAFRDTVNNLLRNPLQWARRNGSSRTTDLWALKDISFDVTQSEIVGVIGSNGAGKSTLLKILSRITEPTSGRIELFGKVGSLLEIGTGFHPELTGRENVFLNGAILGMNRKEIARKFDEIVAFSEIEKFLDTPVKYYSSGMYVRLAFAVAAHMDPEILIIDEVLAVGDAGFQRKCLKKMEEFADGGHTILFVSHSMQAISKLCHRVIYIADGKLVEDGPADDVIKKYVKVVLPRPEVSRDHDLTKRTDRTGTGDIKCTNIRYLDSSGNHVPFLFADEPCQFQIDFEVQKPGITNVKIGLGMDDENGYRIVTFLNDFSGESFDLNQRAGYFRCSVGALNLRPDSYLLTIMLGIEGITADLIIDAATLEVRDSDFYGTGRLPDKAQGPVLMKHNWSLHDGVDAST